MASESVFVLPGDRIDPSLIPTHEKKPLRLGPGLRYVPTDALEPMLAGQLIADRQKNAIRVETSEGRVRTPLAPIDSMDIRAGSH
jgi:exosome complex component RRP40